jgi:hypothetical protein
MDHPGFGVGDVIRIFCRPEGARVARVTERYTFIDWPWTTPDHDSNMVWDGTVALPRDSESVEWQNTPWRIDPEPGEVSMGTSCFIGIPATDVRVVSVEHYIPPKETGRLPRPRLGLSVVPVVSAEQMDEDAGFLIYLDAGEPIEVEVLS